jgi:hypothetical protein
VSSLLSRAKPLGPRHRSGIRRATTCPYRNLKTADRDNLAPCDIGNCCHTSWGVENKLPRIRVNDRATIRLIGETSDLTGHVESIAGGIEDRERSAGSNLLANVNPTFSWVRLAQRIPVRIVLDPLPDGVSLISGRTATVAIAATRDAPPSPLDWLRQWLPRGRSPDADHGGRRLPNAVGKSNDAFPTP